MTQVTLKVAVGQDNSTGDNNNKCSICGNSHDKPKRIKIEPVAEVKKTGWTRVAMSKKFDKGDDKKKSIYPGNTFPPSYSHEGHHCLAFESFVTDADSSPKDTFKKLNYFLDLAKYSPNRHENCIHLPGRPKYDAFWEAIDEDKPLQMHIGDHDDEFFVQSRGMVSRLLSMLTDSDICEEMTIDEIKEDLINNITHAENYVFVKVAKNVEPWKLHPGHEPVAIRLYNMPPDEKMKRPTGDYVYGYDSKKDISSGLKWPEPELKTGIFGKP